MITAIIAAVCFAWFMIYYVEWQKKSPLLSRRPFNCVACLSGWTSLILYFLPSVVSEAALSLFAAAILGIIVEVKMMKL